MPIKIPDKLPATDVLQNENIFIINETKALRQDIRALKIAILNLMPLKIDTEIHLMRLLSNSPLQVEIDLIRTGSYESKNTPASHLQQFYKTFSDLDGKKYDGMIITGAPVEQIDFREVRYWGEMCRIMDWASGNVTSTLFICWAAQSGLYYHYGIPKYPLKEKMSGVFTHSVGNRRYPIVRGFDDVFLAPHSRHTEVRREDIEKTEDLEIISESDEAGIYIVVSKSSRRIFVTGHSEYDPFTLKAEYERDMKQGIKPDPPKNYFPYDDPALPPLVRWRSHANLLFSNWLNYYVYQETPYRIHEISGVRQDMKITINQQHIL